MLDHRVEQLFLQNANDIYAFLVFFTGNPELSKDLTQETFIRAMRRLDDYDKASNKRAWLRTIARNLAVDYQRKWKHETVTDETAFINLFSHTDSPEMELDTNEVRRAILSALSKLKTEYRNVIICREIVGMDTSESAQVLGWSTNKVRVSLHRALQAVRTLLTEEGDL